MDDFELYQLCKNGEDTKKIENLLKRGEIDVNVSSKLNLEGSMTLLMISIVYGDWELFIMLLDYGAVVNLFTKNNKITPLMCSCIHSRTGMTTLLIKYGAKLDVQDAGNWFPLIYAAENESYADMYLLLSVGADYILTTDEGDIFDDHLVDEK